LKQLPEKVYIKHGRYYYDLGRDENRRRKGRALSRVSEGEHALYKALARIHSPNAKTVADMLDSFLAEGMNNLSPATQRDYLGYIRRALRPAFGDMDPADVKPSDIAQYLEFREQGGAGVVANREVACLSSAFNFAMRRGWVELNPCRGARRNREKPKDRYVQGRGILGDIQPGTSSVTGLSGRAVSDRPAPRRGAIAENVAYHAGGAADRGKQDRQGTADRMVGSPAILRPEGE
jgi:hypothetical protein